MAHETDGGTDRGRSAEKPRDIPKQGWLDILKRLRREVKDDRVPLISAAVAFYFMLAIFPALIAVVSIYGLVANPADVERQLQGVATALPEAARSVVLSQLHEIVRTSSGALSFGLIASLLATLWSASAGVRALMEAMNVAYDEEEERGFFKVRAVALVLTLGAILIVVAGIAAVAVVPAVLALGGLGVGEEILAWLRWPALALVVAIGLSVLYRYGPCRDRPKWRWVSWGSGVATVLWLVASLLFSWYVSSFGRFNETYGAIGGVIVLQLWFLISSMAIVLGAELDAEMEHQTARDTTTGREEPLGARGAYVADTLGQSPAG